MFLKILILDVHRQKNFGNLKGSTPKEQYDYYEKKYYCWSVRRSYRSN